MKNLKQKFIFAFLSAFLAAAVLTGFAAPRAEAAVKVTVRNNRAYDIRIAFCWAGQDYGDDTSMGWYVVRPNETRTLNFGSAIAAYTMNNFGYYAKGTPKGGKTLYWHGQNRAEGRDSKWKYRISQANAFRGGHDHLSVHGGVTATFRKCTLNRVNNTDATVSLTF